MKAKNYLKIALLFSMILITGYQAKSQMALKLNVPYGKFKYINEQEDQNEFSEYRFIFGILNNIGWQLYIPLDSLKKIVLICEAGVDAVGTKSSYSYKDINDEDINEVRRFASYGYNFGVYCKYNFLKPELTPYIISGLDLHIQMHNPNLFLFQGDYEEGKEFSDGITTYPYQNRLLFPEITIGGGFTFAKGTLSIEVSDDIGLISVDVDKNIKSNVINFNVIVHF